MSTREPLAAETVTTEHGSQQRGRSSREAAEQIRKRNRMKAKVAQIQKYIATYSNQSHYEDYSDDTFLNDLLYGVGLAMANGTATDYSGPGGYERFKQFLREYLK